MASIQDCSPIPLVAFLKKYANAHIFICISAYLFIQFYVTWLSLLTCRTNPTVLETSAMSGQFFEAYAFP